MFWIGIILGSAGFLCGAGVVCGVLARRNRQRALSALYACYALVFAMIAGIFIVTQT